MKITDIVCHVLLDPGFDRHATSSAQDDIVVEIHTDAGISGIGETDTNPWVARACIESRGTHTMGLGLKEMLLGADPLDHEGLWQRMYVGSAMTGRRGAGVSAIGALDMALWDIKGKALGKPCWQLLGGTPQPHVTPYASLQPAGRNLADYQSSLRDWAVQAKQRGFRAAKLEASLFGPYAHGRLHEPEAALVEVIAACREAVGRDFTLMVDVQYAFSDAKKALRILQQLEPLDLFFIETPLWIDDLDGYAFLHENLGIRVAAGEWQTTRFEFIDLMDRGQVDVAQPDVGRVGGLTEAKRVCDLAAARGRLIVPHCWKTGIGIAASVHLAAATGHCPFVEFLPAAQCDAPLRRELVQEELHMRDGRIALPTRPGLGIELNREALKKFAVR